MFRTFLSYFRPADSDPPPSDPPPSDPPPPYQTNDIPIDIEPSLASDDTNEPDWWDDDVAAAPSIVQEDTPRNRFDYHVELRQRQQILEWEAMHVTPELFGEAAVQRETARTWVRKQWKFRDLWNPGWLEHGPDENARWRSYGVPACLLSMELSWEIEHQMYTSRPIFIPAISGDNPRGMGLPDTSWPCDRLARTALSNVRSHWEEWGFSTAKIQQPSVLFREDLPHLYPNLPLPASKLLSQKVHRWEDLLPTVRRRGPIRDVFGFELPRDVVLEADRIEGSITEWPSPTTHQSTSRGGLFDKELTPPHSNPREEVTPPQSTPRWGLFGEESTQTQGDPTPELGLFGRPPLPRAEQEAEQRREHYHVFTTMPAPRRAAEADRTMETRTQRDPTSELGIFGRPLLEQEAEERRTYSDAFGRILLPTTALEADRAVETQTLSQLTPRREVSGRIVSPERELEADQAEEVKWTLHQQERRTGNRGRRQRPLGTRSGRIRKRNRRARTPE